jgi:hypothetical protein
LKPITYPTKKTTPSANACYAGLSFSYGYGLLKDVSYLSYKGDRKMTTFYDEFTKMPVAKIAQQISDMTFAFQETRVPSKHYKDKLSKSFEEVVEDSVAINLLNTYYKTLKTLFDENPKWFMEAILCIDMRLKPSTIKADEYQALELTYAKFSDNESKHTDLEYLSLYQNIRDNGAQFLMNNGGINNG